MCVCLREYWLVVEQKDTILSGDTLNFLDSVNWIMPRSFFLDKHILSKDHFMMQGYFQRQFHPPVGHEFQENEKKVLGTLLVRLLSYHMAEPA